MFQPARLETTQYAKRSDFCDALEQDMKLLYLLAFLLTCNHKEAEQCFTSTVEAVFQDKAVFKEWVPSWIKRSLIKNAVRMVSPAAPGRSGIRNLWAAQGASPEHSEIDAVTRLAPLERFVFVMSVLEGYSPWECSLLLGCDIKAVARARRRALANLPAEGARAPKVEAQPWLRLQVSA